MPAIQEFADYLAAFFAVSTVPGVLYLLEGIERAKAADFETRLRHNEPLSKKEWLLVVFLWGYFIWKYKDDND